MPTSSWRPSAKGLAKALPRSVPGCRSPAGSPPDPLLNKIPRANPELTCKLYSLLPEKRKTLECLVAVVADPIPEQVVPVGQDGTIRVRLAGLACGDYPLKTVIRHRETQQTILEAAYAISIVDPPAIDRSKIRQLNNLVAEVPQPDGRRDAAPQSFTFVNPRDGWVFVAFTTGTPAPGLTVKLGDSDTVITAATDRLEAFRELAAGEHRITVSGNHADARLIVRSIPEIFDYPPCANSHVPENGSYGWDFMKKHILYAVTTLNGGTLPGDALPEAKARGLKWLANFGVDAPGDPAELRDRMEKHRRHDPAAVRRLYQRRTVLRQNHDRQLHSGPEAAPQPAEPAGLHLDRRQTQHPLAAHRLHVRLPERFPGPRPPAVRGLLPSAGQRTSGRRLSGRHDRGNHAPLQRFLPQRGCRNRHHLRQFQPDSHHLPGAQSGRRLQVFPGHAGQPDRQQPGLQGPGHHGLLGNVLRRRGAGAVVLQTHAPLCGRRPQGDAVRPLWVQVQPRLLDQRRLCRRPEGLDGVAGRRRLPPHGHHRRLRQDQPRPLGWRQRGRHGLRHGPKCRPAQPHPPNRPWSAKREKPTACSSSPPTSRMSPARNTTRADTASVRSWKASRSSATRASSMSTGATKRYGPGPERRQDQPQPHRLPRQVTQLKSSLSTTNRRARRRTHRQLRGANHTWSEPCQAFLYVRSKFPCKGPRRGAGCC